MGIGAALLLEALLLLMLLTLGRTAFAPAGEDESVVTFDVQPAPEPAAEAEEPTEDARTEPEEQQAAEPAEPAEPRPAEPDTPEPVPAPSPSPTQPAFIPMTRDDLAAADISEMPQSRQRQEPSGPAYGPSAPTGPSDTEVVGTAPNGEPLYAARWYREPTDQELRGYLSTARPGYALIACKTAPQWRVEDCVGLEEYPEGSNLERAVLAAAWQFQVRPPRRGGESLVGSWVRIRINYNRGG